MKLPSLIFCSGLFWASLRVSSYLGMSRPYFSWGVLYLDGRRLGDACESGGLCVEYKWVVLTVTTVGIVMATLDSGILVLGLPHAVVALNTTLRVGVWFITLYR